MLVPAPATAEALADITWRLAQLEALLDARAAARSARMAAITMATATATSSTTAERAIPVARAVAPAPPSPPPLPQRQWRRQWRARRRRRERLGHAQARRASHAPVFARDGLSDESGELLHTTAAVACERRPTGLPVVVMAPQQQQHHQQQQQRQKRNQNWSGSGTQSQSVGQKNQAQIRGLTQEHDEQADHDAVASGLLVAGRRALAALGALGAATAATAIGKVALVVCPRALAALRLLDLRILQAKHVPIAVLEQPTWI